MCKVITVKPTGYQKGYPVIKRSRYKSSNDRTNQPLLDTNQYPKKDASFSKFVWQRINWSATNYESNKQNTSNDTIKITQNSENKHPKQNDNDNSSKKHQHKALVSWKQNYYFPLIASLYDQVNNNIINYSAKERNESDLETSASKALSSSSITSSITSKSKSNHLLFNELEYLNDIIEENSKTNIQPITNSLNGIYKKQFLSSSLIKSSSKYSNKNQKMENTAMTTRAKAAKAAQAKASQVKQRVDELVVKSKSVSSIVKKVAMIATAIACQNHSNNNNIIDDTLCSESNKYIPRKMPNFSSIFKSEYKDNEEEDDVSTIHDLSIVVKIDRNKNKHHIINNRRLFIAISKALKYFATDLKTTIRNSNHDFDDFDNVTHDEEELTTYFMESPTVSQNQIYTVRLNYKSTMAFHRIMHKNNELKHWLKSEGITLELNHISEIHLVNVGFFIKCHPKSSIIKSQVKRLTDLMELEEDEIPEFMAYASPVWHND